MLIAQIGAFIIFKDLADISQWVVQSSREFTMLVWYNRHILAGLAIGALVISIVIWFKDRNVCSKPLLGFLLFLFAFSFYSGMINPKLMFRAQQLT